MFFKVKYNVILKQKTFESKKGLNFARCVENGGLNLQVEVDRWSVIKIDFF